jgi:hypothetical protein
LRGIPSAGKSGLSWNGSQRTAGFSSSGLRSWYIRSADSRRRLPMKHQGQTMSETIPMASFGLAVMRWSFLLGVAVIYPGAGGELQDMDIITS